MRVKVFDAYGSVAPLLQILEAASEAFASQGDDEGIDKAEKIDAFIETLERAAKPLEGIKVSLCMRILYYVSIHRCDQSKSVCVRILYLHLWVSVYL